MPTDRGPLTRILGPYYPAATPPRSTNDLTIVDGATGPAHGEVIEVAGRVLNQAGHAVSGAEIIIWQANSFGRYTHPNDCSPAPADPCFLGCAEMLAGSDGAYHLKTVKPGPYGAKSRPDAAAAYSLRGSWRIRTARDTNVFPWRTAERRRPTAPIGEAARSLDRHVDCGVARPGTPHIQIRHCSRTRLTSRGWRPSPPIAHIRHFASINAVGLQTDRQRPAASNGSRDPGDIVHANEYRRRSEESQSAAAEL